MPGSNWNQAQHDYDAKVEGIVNGIQARVDEDKETLAIIQANEEAIKQERNREAQAHQPYYSAKARLETFIGIGSVANPAQRGSGGGEPAQSECCRRARSGPAGRSPRQPESRGDYPSGRYWLG